MVNVIAICKSGYKYFPNFDNYYHRTLSESYLSKLTHLFVKESCSDIQRGKFFIHTFEYNFVVIKMVVSEMVGGLGERGRRVDSDETGGGEIEDVYVNCREITIAIYFEYCYK